MILIEPLHNENNDTDLEKVNVLYIKSKSTQDSDGMFSIGNKKKKSDLKKGTLYWIAIYAESVFTVGWGKVGIRYHLKTQAFWL